MSDIATLRREVTRTGNDTFVVSSTADVRLATEVSRWITPIGMIAIALVVSAPLYFSRGIGVFDDSLYLKGGQLILDGLRPYRDFYDIKPPGIYYVSAAIAAAGGRGWLAPRIFLFLFAVVFQIVVIRRLQSDYGSRVATFAAIFLGLSYPFCQGYSLHTEPFGAAAAFAACAVVLADAGSTKRWALAGALIGLATLFKQTGVLYLVALGTFAVLDRREQDRWSASARTLIALVGGFAAILALMVIVFIASGLAQPLLDGAVFGAALRADFPFQRWYAIVATWIRCPALIAFLPVALVLLMSRAARQAMDETERRAFGLFVCVGIFSLLPTLKQGGVSHYLQPGAFAFSAACALFLNAYLKKAPLGGRLVAAVTFAGMAAYLVVLGGLSVDMLKQNKIGADLSVQTQMREMLDARLAPNDPVLCVSGPATPRLYLMSGRRPFNRFLYFHPITDGMFSFSDARRLLVEGRPKAAVVEINPADNRPVLTDAEVASLRSLYDVVPLGPQTPLRLIALFRQQPGETVPSTW